ncbi:hypothetical protein [Bdellovibrio sp. HCB209]|uniref:hypothetical protein n=1 Tax=Bdellovibrio sp. HCB209 TaxID=3394354 RepID=UPI0039B5CEFC
MSLYSYLNAQHNSALKKAEHIQRLPVQDKISRKIFLDDLILHIKSLFLAEQVSLFAASEHIGNTTNFLESSLRNQEMVMSTLKSHALEPREEDDIPYVLHTYQLNQQTYVYPYLKTQIPKDLEQTLGYFSAQFYDQVCAGTSSRDALIKTSGNLPFPVKERARLRLDTVLNPRPLHQTA